MTVNDLEQRVSDLERRHERTRALLVDALSAVAILTIGFYVQPEGWHGAILGFFGWVFVPGLIRSLFLRDAPAKAPDSRKRTPPPVAPWRDLDRGAVGNRKAG